MNLGRPHYNAEDMAQTSIHTTIVQYLKVQLPVGSLTALKASSYCAPMKDIIIVTVTKVITNIVQQQQQQQHQ